MFNIIARKTLIEFINKYPDAKISLEKLYRELLSSDFKNFNELKTQYPSISIVDDDRVVFNIMGNKYRLLVRIVFDFRTIQIKWFGTHSEYDKINVNNVKFKKK